MPSSKKIKTLKFSEGDVYVSDPHLTDRVCECGGLILEIGDYALYGINRKADYITMYNCVECNQPYEVYHRKQ